VRTLPALLLVALALVHPLLPADAVAQDGAEPLAVLMSVQGTVTVQAADGGTRAGAFGMHLNPGDTVQTGEDASAEILFSSGNLVQVGSNSRTGVGQPRTASGSSNPNFQSVQSFLKLKDSRGTSSVGTLRSGGTREALSLRQPCQSRVSVDDLRFSWHSEDPAPELKLPLYGEDGVVFETEVLDAEEFASPADAPELVPGVSYSWTVETTDPLVIPPLRSPTGLFELISDEEQKKLDDQLAAVDAGMSTESGHLYRASIYYGYGMLDQAIEETSTALEDDLANDELRSILARLLNEAGRSAEAVEEYDRLLKPR